ncbi:TIGR02300 family protein [Aliirhizobium smilacinae]|uniref:TIGR02300 family protein n=1 Tax=Aliirhizobium smilacinae TaxID=1395944 RepID=A0A5C4XTU6_9HYPH|nr:TIGR02300 family protein [Rhizobium smilacinae]TNM66581.1 TIGR02300 family protein [Rhizobium smilacinae]
MAKAELGTKRTDPDTGKKFYDLNRDPVVSPYSGKSWPMSFFAENSAAIKMEQAAEDEDDVKEVDSESQEAEVVSLEDADSEASGDDIPDIGDDEDVDIGDDDDDTFLEQEDEDDDDMTGIIGVGGDDDEQ